MKIGFSFSPGGFLFTYHLGVLEALAEHGYINEETPLAGSSAGALAIGAFCFGKTNEAIESCVRISQQCKLLGGHRGRLLPLLETELDRIAPLDAHNILNARKGFFGIGYAQIFPYPKGVLQHKFGSRSDLIEAVCNSSMFPFFVANKIFIVRKSKKSKSKRIEKDKGKHKNYVRRRLSQCTKSLPRFVMDGLFSVPRSRFGCPQFPRNTFVDRTVTVCVFPHKAIRLTASNDHDQISPIPENGETEKELFKRLRRIALIETSPPEVHHEMFARGKKDGLRWIMMEKKTTESRR